MERTQVSNPKEMEQTSKNRLETDTIKMGPPRTPQNEEELNACMRR